MTQVMGQRHFQFAWDERKAADNVRKHGVSFLLAARMLADPDADRFHVEEFDAKSFG